MTKTAKRRPMRRSAVRLLAAAGLLVLARPASAADPIEMHINQGTCVCSAPLSVALKKGYLDDELKPLNVKLGFLRFETGPAQTAALQSGGLDLGLYGAPPSVGLVANGMPVKLVMMADDPADGEGLAVKAGINSVQDLIGKKLATPLGTSGDVMMRGMLKTYNLPADKIEIVNLDPAAMAAAWERNDIQAGYIWDPWFSKLAAMGGAKLVTDGQLVKASGGKYNAGWDMWVVRSAFAEAHPDVLHAVLRAFDKAAKYLRANPAEAAEAIYTMHGVGSAEQLLAQLKADTFPTAEESRGEKYLGSEGSTGQLAEALMSTWEVMHDSGKLRTAPALETAKQAIDPQYLP